MLICEEAFIKIYVYHFPFGGGWGGGGGRFEQTTEQTSLGGGLFKLFLNIFLFSYLI